MSKKRKDSSRSATLLDYFASSPKKTRHTVSKAPSKLSVIDSHEQDIIVISSDHEPDNFGDCGDRNLKKLQKVPENGTSLTFGKEEPLPSPGGSQDGEPNFFDTITEDVPILCDIPDPEIEWDLRDDEYQEVEDTMFDSQVICETDSRVDTYQEDTTCPICMKVLNGLFASEIERHVNSCLDASSCVVDSSIPFASSSIQPQPSKTAFSILMSGHEESKVWKEATKAENQRGKVAGRRSAPFYKVLQGMPIAVDAFRYGKIPGVTGYFLTHAHSDHYTNLSSNWKNGLIYCSQTTANLIIQMLKVDSKWVRPLPLDIPTIIPETGGVQVTLIRANHCPGSVLFLFEGQQTVNAGDSTYKSPHIGSSKIFRYLHCGDFRACPKHTLHNGIKGVHIDTVYLDTTYLNPRYCFPPQPLVISACASLARRLIPFTPEAGVTDSGRHSLESLTNWLRGSDKGKGKEKSGKDETLVVVGTYTIGKERIVKAIAKSLSTKVYCDPRKLPVLRCVDDDELHELLTTDPLEAGVHIVPLHMIVSDKLSEYLEKWKGRWTRLIGFRPTGWTYSSNGNNVDNTFPSIPHIISRDQSRDFTDANLRPARNSTAKVLLYNVPYSEHSSFFELTCFAMSLDWGKIIATVNVGNPRSRAKMEQWFEKWRIEKARRLKDDNLKFVQYRSLDYW